MARIEQFEDLLSWQEARVWTHSNYQCTNTADFANDFGLRDQNRRAVLSVRSNIAEGFERGGDRESQPFLSRAKGSGAAVRAQRCIALDETYTAPTGIEALKGLTLEISGLISGILTYLANSHLGGRKFKQSPNPRPSKP